MRDILAGGFRMRLAIAQINTTVGDFSGNSRKIFRGFANARKAQADLLVFPEMTIPGYPPEDLLFKRAFVDANLRALKYVAAQSRGLQAVLGFVDRDAGGKLYNAAAVLVNGHWVGTYRKIELPNYGVFDEKRYFSKGSEGCLLDLNGLRIGLSICEDIWLPESYVYEPPYRGGTSLILNLSASPYHMGKQSQRKALIEKLAKHTGAHVAYVNLVGGQDELVFDGGSLLVSPSGKTLAAGAYLGEDFLVRDLLLHPRRENTGVPISQHLPFQTIPLNLRGKSPKKPLLQFKNTLARPFSRQEEVYRALVLGTRDYVEKNAFDKVLIGLSGGVDSALVACIAVDALGASRVLGLTMPSRYTSSETYHDSIALAKKLKIKLWDLSIETIYSAYLGTLKSVFSEQKHGITEENLQARIRGNLLMALSNKFGHLVLTTGNKSEMATGYCTLYGDMAGGFAVIKDVPKTLVYRLARFRNRRDNDFAIPGSVLRRAPSAELRPEQKDQDTLPPYHVLDVILKNYVEGDCSLEELSQKGVLRPLARSVVRRVDRNEYKRRQAPPGLKITPKAFGRDRRMPITNKFSL